MYTIKAFVDDKEYTIHNPRVKSLTVGNPYFEIGDNANGKAEFLVYPEHPHYEHVKKLTTDIVFYKDGEPEFYGRVLYDDEDFKGAKEVFVEGELAFLCDSVQKTKVYHDHTVEQYLQDLINIHNTQVEERKQFVLGRVTVTDSNDSLYRYSNWETTREILKDKLTDRLGGHLVIRHENGLRILDYLSDNDFYMHCSQTIRFGKNLLDFAKNLDATELATCIVPLGAKVEGSEVGILEERLTIESVNGGVHYVTDDNAVREYGKIYKTVTWDDVKVAENLKKKGEEYLKSVQFEKMVLECKAIDMNLADDEVEAFKIGHMVRCISEPNGLDSEFPITKKKVYISQFNKNTVVLGDGKENVSYTSSNRQETANIEKVIESMPSKREILQEAIRDATDLINERTQSGHAIHTPNEFIVSDTKGVEDAKNLWRWGLGGLAHYSQGYDGPVDGIALTMDGKINGKMLLAESVVAESIDIGYRSSVERKITEAETAAKDYADDEVRVAKETIETSLKNTENRINMAVNSTKEIVSRKNYVENGEQEMLSISDFVISGSAATVETAEFLNTKCLKLSFSATGIVYLSQDLGELPAGDYTIHASAAFPEGVEKRPSYISYGFSTSSQTTYFSPYSADEFHTFKRSLSVTKAARTIRIGVYGTAGKVCYITNIRCLRDMQELLDDLQTDFTVEMGKVTASVTDLYENSQHNYCEDGIFSKKLSENWYASHTSAVFKTTWPASGGKTCVCINAGTAGTTSAYLRSKASIKIPKAGKVVVRFKAYGPENVRVRCQFYSTKYTDTGDIGPAWTEQELVFDNVPAGSRYIYFYCYTAESYVYLTDIEILGYMSAYSESQFQVLQDSIEAEVTRAVGVEETLEASIKVNADNITNAVKKGEFGSYVTQYYDRVITAFNNSSKYVQISAGEIAIYDYGVSASKKRAVFDERGNHFYRDNYYIGKIGTNSLQGDSSKKGLNFDLEYPGAYMTWAAQDYSGAGTYTMKWTYVQKNKGWSNYEAGRLHAGCDIDMHNWTLRNVAWPDGGITGTMYFVQVKSMSSDGTVSQWVNGAKLQFKNGILISGTWN